MQPVVEEWDSDDEDKLEEYMEAEVTLADTALGRQRDMMKQQIFSAGVALSHEDFNHLLEIRKRKSDEMGGDNDDESNSH